MKVSKKDIQLLMAAAGILIAVCAYLFVYTKYTDAAVILEGQNTTLSAEVNRLQALNANRDTYLSETERMKKEISEFEIKFPADILPEDNIMMVVGAEDANRTFVSQISFGATTEVPNTVVQNNTNQAQQAQQAAAAATADPAAQAAAVPSPISTEVTAYPDTRLYNAPISIGIECTYDDFKSLVNYIYGQKNRMSIKGVSVAYNPANGNLIGNMTLDTFYLTGTDKVYVESDIPGMGMGVETLFGNME